MSFKLSRVLLRGWWMIALVVSAPLGGSAQTYTPTPITGARLEVPYRYTGLLIARPTSSQSGYSGSGAVVGHPRVVYSCAHLVYDEVNGGWFSYVRWFQAWNSGIPPSENVGQFMRGYRSFQGYASAARIPNNSTGAYNLDFVVHYAYNNTAGGIFAESLGDAGAASLRSSATKLVTGYPSGLYASGDAKRYLMHQTGPFTRPFTALTDNLASVSDVSTGPGNSGGPVWVKNGDNYYYAGEVLAGTSRSQGDSTDSLAAYALSSASRALIEEGIAGATLPDPKIYSQPSSRRVYAGASVTFSAGVDALAVTKYQWYFNGQPIAGATSTSYTVASASAATSGYYYLVASNESGSTTSQIATLSVEPELRILEQPVDVAAILGSPATLSLKVTGLNLSYGWYFVGGSYVGSSYEPKYTFPVMWPAMEGQYYVVVEDSQGRRLQSNPATVKIVSSLADMAQQPANQWQKAGSSATFTAAAKAAGATYQWYFNGAPIAGATGSSYTVTNVRVGNEGSYRILVRDGSGNLGWSSSATLSVGFSRLVNISTRGYVPPGATLVPGFVMRGGGGAKPILARAAGPALRDQQVSAPLANPSLSVISQDTRAEFAANRNWGDSAGVFDAARRVGAFPFKTDSLDAAVTQTLPLNNGGYTVKVSDEGTIGGVALAEIYEAEYDGISQIINVSTLGFTGAGERVLIAGFVVQGNIPKPLLIRGVGPGLEPYGVGERLADPQIELVRQQDGKAIPIASNDNWGGTAELKAAFAKAGAFELTDSNSRDAALIATVEPGVYTVVVSGMSGATGNVLVEIYDLEF